MLQEIDFETFEKEAKEQQAKSQTLVFVNGKATAGEGLTFRPWGGLCRVVSVYDEQLKINREPRPGEKATTKYLVRGLDKDRNPKVYSAGISVISRIKEIRSDADTEDLYVLVTSSGTGKNTEYATSRNKALSGKVTKAEVEALQKLDLVKIAASLIKTPSPEAATDAATPGKPVGDDDTPWGA